MIWVFTSAAVLLLMTSLVVVHRRRAADQGQNQRASQLARLRQRVEQVESLTNIWTTYSDNPQVARQLYLTALELVDRIAAISPATAYAATEQERLLEQLRQCEAPPAAAREACALGSINEVSRLRSELRDIKRILHARVAGDLLGAEQYQQLAADIDRLDTRLTLDSYVSLAREALRQQQTGKAAKLLGQVQELLGALDPADPRADAYQHTIDPLLRQVPPQPVAPAKLTSTGGGRAPRS